METKPPCANLFYRKNCFRTKSSLWGQLTKTVLIMKLMILLTAVFLQLQAAGISQTVSFKGNKVPLEKVFAIIKKQTGYLFFYDPAVLQHAHRITVDAKDLPLELFIKQILHGQPLNYSIENKTIFINKTPSGPDDVIGQIQKAEPISGMVVDSAGRPIAEVTVTIRGTNRTVRTDAGGRFTINANTGDVLVFTHVNLQEASYKISGDEEISITMQTRVSELNEVAVTLSTGYKQMPKSQITGAASVIDQKVYDQRVAVTGNFLESLEGKVPGLVYNSQSGDLSIRGVSTFDAVKKPLIVIDGFPTEIDINTINPNDIISVSVLRDAAAASVYGVRASNGVIVIETKRGKTGEPVFSLRATYATQPRPDFSYLNLTDAAEIARIQYKQFRDVDNIPKFIFELLKWPISPVQAVVFDVKDSLITEDQAQQKLAEVGAYDNLKDYERLFYRNRQARQIDFDVSGGNNKNSYLLGINYVNELPQERESANSRILLNLANTFRLSRLMKFDFRGTYTNVNNSQGTIPSYNTLLPWEKFVDENGNALPTVLSPSISYIGTINEENNELVKSYGLYDHRYFPYSELRANTTETKRDAMRFQGRLNTILTRWLNFDIGAAFENENTFANNLITDENYTLRQLINTRARKDPSTGKAMFVDIPQGNALRRTTTRSWNYTLRGQFNFNYLTTNQLHDISGIAGIEQRRQKSSGYLSSVFGYDGNSLVSKPLNLATLGSGGSPEFSELGFMVEPFDVNNYFNETHSDRRFMSYYAEATYMFDQRFIATGSVRLDQSNLFGTAPEYRNKPFWSVGAGWRLNKEAFLSDISWLNELKLRASYGFNGNVPVSDNGPFLLLKSGINSRMLTAQLANDILSPENQSIRWETTTNYNIGIDYNLFNDRIWGTFDYYYKKANDVFGSFSSDPTSGFNSYNANTATILNKGIEVGLNSVNVQSRKFSWRTGLTASFNINRVVDVMKSDNNSTYSLINIANVQKGQPLDVLLSYNYAGLNELGQPLVYTVKGEKVLMDFATQADVTTDDLIYSGTTTPKYVLGLNNQFTIGKFDLSFLFMFYGGHVMRVAQPSPDLVIYGRAVKGSEEYWSKPGDELVTKRPGLPVYNSPGDFTAAARYGYLYAHEYVRKADFIRLRDLILTYHIDHPWLSRAGIKNTQVRLQAQNLWRYTFSGNDIDPDAIDRRSGDRRLELQPMMSFSLYTNF